MPAGRSRAPTQGERLQGLSLIDQEDAPAPVHPTADGPGVTALGGLGVSALFLAALAIVLTTGWAAYLYLPFSDPHSWIGGVFDAEHSGDWLQYVWRPYNAQRIPIALLTQALDIEAVHGHAPVFLLVAAALWLCGCIAVLALIWRSRLRAPVALCSAAVASVLLANARLAEDLALPVFSVYLFVVGPALAAAAMLQFAPREGLRGPAIWAAIALAALSSCGNAAGLAIWPALVVAALMQERGREQLWALLAAALVTAIVVEAGLGAPVGVAAAGRLGVSDHLQRMAVYFCAFGGLPWSRMSDTPAGVGVGGLVWVLAAWTIGRAQAEGPRPGDPVVIAGVTLIVFGFIAAVLATVGRVDEGIRPLVPTRYTPFATALQVGVVLSSTRGLQGQGARVLSARAVLIVTTVLLLDLHETRAIRHVSKRIRQDSAAFNLGKPPAANAFTMSPDPELAHEVRAELARRGLPH